MQIKRDYSEPLFGPRRRKRSSARWLVLAGLLGLIAMILFLYFTRFEQLRTLAYEMIGSAPTVTPLPSDLAMQAAVLFQSGNVPAAAQLYAQAIAQRPDNVEYLYEYGQVLIELDRYAEAIQIADQLITLAPRDVRGYALKTRGLAFSGDSAAAISLGTIALEINPDFGALHAALARAYADSARYREALDAGKRAVELDPFYHDAHRSYAHVFTMVAENELAIGELERAIELNPGILAPYFELAFQYLALDQNELAIATYDRVLAMQPNNAKALLRQCEAYRKIGQFNRARGFCEDAVQADPTYAQAQFQLGIILYNERDWAGALDAFEQCYRYNSASLECNYRRGLAQYYLGNCAPAIAILQDSLRVAQTRGGLENTIAIISEGLTAAARDCPTYNPSLDSFAPTPNPQGG